MHLHCTAVVLLVIFLRFLLGIRSGILGGADARAGGRDGEEKSFFSGVRDAEPFAEAAGLVPVQIFLWIMFYIGGIFGKVWVVLRGFFWLEKRIFRCSHNESGLTLKGRGKPKKCSEKYDYYTNTLTRPPACVSPP